MPTVGAILIGRNEGERLERALRAACAQADRVVYVDSGSTDGSVALARSMGVTVVELDLSQPFTAARARNAGAERLLADHPDTEYLQFIDGDCELVDGWLDAAAGAMGRNEKLAAVSGRLRELHPEQSVYNRLIDLEWDTPIGEAASCGGIAMFRTQAFSEAGRFDPTIAAGEEPELCMRLRHAGWKIERIDQEMALHDAAITKLSQWLRRSVRTGRGSLDLVTRFGDQGSGFGAIARRARWWGLVYPLAIVFAAVLPLAGFGVAHLFVGDGSLMPIGVAVSSLLVFSLLMLGMLKVSYTFLRSHVRGLSQGDALVFALLDLLGKFAEVRGQLGYLRDQRSGRTTRLIEYKTTTALAAAGKGLEAEQV